MLQDFDRACRDKHAPHLLPEALAWRQRYLATAACAAGASRGAYCTAIVPFMMDEWPGKLQKKT